MGRLTDAQRKVASRPFEGDAARTNWNYLPSGGSVQRDGLSLAELSDVQRIAVHRIFSAALSSQGYGKVAQILWLDDVLRADVTARMEAAAAQGAPTADLERLLQLRSSQQYWLNFLVNLARPAGAG